MKGVNKCYGLLLVLAIIFGLSLSVSSDVSAYMYNIDVIPLGHAVTKGSLITHNLGGYRINYAFDSAFRIGAPGLQLSDFSDSFYQDSYTYRLEYSEDGWLGSGPSCVWVNNGGRHMYNPQYSGGSSDTFYYYDFDFPYYDSDLTYTSSNLNNQQYCNVNGPVTEYPVDTRTFPAYVFGSPDYRSLVPFRYNYNGIYRSSTVDGDGFVRSAKFDLAELFKEDHIPSTFSTLVIPFGRLSSNFESISQGSTFDFRGSFYLDSDDPENDVFDFNSNALVKITAKGYPDGWDSNQPSSLGTSQCAISHVLNSNPNEAPHIVSYHCLWTSNYDFEDSSLLGFTLELLGNQRSNPNVESPSYLWNYPATAIYFDNAFVVTNSDPTPASSKWSDYVIDGNDSNVSPGYAGNPFDEVDVDFFSSLTNLFNFSFSNPFAPIFQMFSSGSDCVNIPTLAGMLHSNETQVCPWFDSNTRSIVTPVLGLSSMMLVFGFAVHWLGARSGNLFEDSVETDNYSFANKFRRKK